MKSSLIVGLLISTAALQIFAQSGGTETKSAKEVLTEFWRVETRGGRLKAEDWCRVGNSFFVHSSAPPEKKMIALVSSKYKCSVDVRSIKGDHAEIVNECIELGRIDNELRYTPPEPGHDKTDIVHYLVLTDKHWELEADGIKEREVTGPSAWRIENPEPLLWLDLDTAISYLTHASRKSTNPALRQNAERTLSRLKPLH